MRRSSAVRSALRRKLPLHATTARAPTQRLARQYNFASTQYVSAFGDVPAVDVAAIRADTLAALEAFDEEAWYRDPLVTVIDGVAQEGGEEVDTTDAFGQVNGRQVQASTAVVDATIDHVLRYRSPATDLREQVRAAEARMLSVHAASLIANQAKDFMKQDGVTEIEESLEANPVERTLNDQLLQDEREGRIAITRDAAFVGCVSNFSNFLDLCRKTLRQLEVGVPCVLLSRSNTSQHTYRWFQLLSEELCSQGVQPGMLTFVSCDIAQQRRIMAACSASPLYLTGSREVAAKIKELLPNTFSSTGGPNTMVSTELTPAIAAAVRMSATIENSGQCTALRHVVVPGMQGPEDVAAMLQGPYESVGSPADSLSSGGFDGLFTQWGESFELAESGYTRHSDQSTPLAFKLGEHGEAFPYGIQEHWRRVYVDVTSPRDKQLLQSEAYLTKLARWLVTEQPISLAVNGDDEQVAAGFPIASRLFEQTAQVVYSVGSLKEPCLSCQARPQDGEIFGEFPPRRSLSTYTKSPVFVPSATASCNTHYERAFLQSLPSVGAVGGVDLSALSGLVGSSAVRGYLSLLAEHLHDACGPKRGYGARSTLWGLQTPPLNGDVTLVRAGADCDSFDQLAPTLLPFWLTNASKQAVLSYDPANTAMAQQLQGLGDVLTLRAESEEQFLESASSAWNVVRPGELDESALPLVGPFLSVLFPMGHIKSTMSGADDEAFLRTFEQSPKWLRMRA